MDNLPETLPDFPYRITSDGNRNFKVEELAVKKEGGRGRKTKKENIGQVYVVATRYYPNIEQAVHRIYEIALLEKLKEEPTSSFTRIQELLETNNVFIKKFAKLYYKALNENNRN